MFNNVSNRFRAKRPEASLRPNRLGRRERLATFGHQTKGLGLVPESVHWNLSLPSHPRDADPVHGSSSGILMDTSTASKPGFIDLDHETIALVTNRGKITYVTKASELLFRA